MDLNTLKMLGQIAGIGGIAFGVFLILFREVIRKTIFPKLTKAQGYGLLKLFLILVWSIAVIGVCAWVFVENKSDHRPAPGRLEVTDIIVDDYRPDFNASLDFRVANQGNSGLSISRIRFKVAAVEKINARAFLPSSAQYNLDISDLTEPGEQAEVTVSQEVPQGSDDRFTVLLTARKMRDAVFRVWKLTPILVTSEGEVEAKEITVGLPWNVHKSSRLPRAR